MDEKFQKPYNPAETEGRIYAAWEESGFFSPDICVEKGVTEADAPPYAIVLPPPNVTGRLHMGHALMLAIEDIMIRVKRMQGYRTLWLPGTDHAAIATQSVVEKKISKEEGKSRHDLGREELLRRIGEFANESHDTIVGQVKIMGSSLDWSREVFTLDEERTYAVRTMFKNMYDAGLIYRGNRIINWDPKGQTTISDDEIVHEERNATLYTFKYSSEFPIAISTTRPETKVGDTAVAVHPDDARYKEYVGKEYSFTFCDVPVTVRIVADEDVDPAFGTGALGVTPAHSQTDWEIADRHDLPRPQVINEYAKMTVDGRLNGKKTIEAREMVVEWLRSEGLLEKEEEIVQNISLAERTSGIIEPLPKLQWFINVTKPFVLEHSKLPGIASGSETTLKEVMRAAVGKGGIEILPDYSTKTYMYWVDNLRDWCISRQIWYGHQVPVWYRGEEMYVGVEAPHGDGWKQDPDTLDTWFSSGLWTFSTMGWPDAWDGKTGTAKPGTDLSVWRPTDVLETGYDILPFWVARMILMTGFALGEIPFKRVYLHGLVRDAQGRKMSKSLGNNMDPIDVTNKFGADAARMALVVGNTPGTDMRISEDKIKGYKHFANKLWNISRFVLENTQGADLTAALTDTDQELKAEFDALAKEVTADIEAYRLYLAAEKLYHYTWSRLADELIEASKTIIFGEDEVAKASRKAVLMSILTDLLKLLHPFMPFVTEEIWSSMPTRSSLLMVTRWPATIEEHDVSRDHSA